MTGVSATRRLPAVGSRTAPRRIAATLAVVLVVLVPHWPAGRVDFVYDDDGFIVANPAAHSVAAAVGAVLKPFPPDQAERRLYRPVTAVSYGVDYRLWRGDARGFAVTNVALYLAAALLAWRFFASWLGSGPAALAAALLFAAHPVHAEAVDAIAGRSELLALLFSLVAAQLLPAAAARASSAGPAMAGRLRSAGSALAYALACGAKETAVVLPGVLAVLAVARLPGGPGWGGRVKRVARPLVPHLLVLAGYLLLRHSVLGGFAPLRSPLGGSGLAVRVFTAGQVFLEYLRLLVSPSDLRVDGAYLTRVGIAPGPTARSLLGLALLAALLGLAGVVARGLARGTAPVEGDPRRGLLAGVGTFLVFLVPVSHVVPIGALMAERFLFAPSLGFALAGAAAGQLLARRLVARLPAGGRRAAATAGVGALCILVALGGWRSRVRAGEWRDAVAFWRAAEQDLPGSYLVKVNLAAELMQRGDFAGAERRLREALAIRPGAPEAARSLSLIPAERRRPPAHGEPP